jgi:cell division protein FtsB
LREKKLPYAKTLWVRIKNRKNKYNGRARMTQSILEQSTEKMATLVNENFDLKKENAQLKRDVETLLERIRDNEQATI